MYVCMYVSSVVVECHMMARAMDDGLRISQVLHLRCCQRFKS
jgi:hypothetical protein